MTREEAKALLLNISAYDIDTQRGMKKQEAIEMAIKALEQEPCDKCLYSTSEGCQYDDITETIPPFEDCISRQAVLDVIEREQFKGDAITEIEKLPPVTPQQKYGKWIRIDKDKCKCDQCEVISLIAMYPNGDKNYCPNCGIRMVESQESEEEA